MTSDWPMMLGEQMFADEGVRLYRADCTELLDDPRMEACVDHVITDPPYDAKTAARRMSTRGGAPVKVGGGEHLAAVDGATLGHRFVRLARRWAIAFCALEQLGAYELGAADAWVRAGVFARIAPMPQITGDRPGQAAEGIAIMHRAGTRKRWNGGGSAAMWRARSHAHLTGEHLEHPTPKPLPLMRELIRQFTGPGDLILDPFCGSGTTGLAARLEGRRCILIERHGPYAEEAARRLARMPGEKDGQGALPW